LVVCTFCGAFLWIELENHGKWEVNSKVVNEMCMQEDNVLDVESIARPRRNVKSAAIAKVAKTMLLLKLPKVIPTKAMGLPKTMQGIPKVQKV